MFSTVLTLYKRTTSVGRIYNSTYVEKVYELHYEDCSKVVPKIFTTQTKFETFQLELSERITNMKTKPKTSQPNSPSLKAVTVDEQFKVVVDEQQVE